MWQNVFFYSKSLKLQPFFVVLPSWCLKDLSAVKSFKTEASVRWSITSSSLVSSSSFHLTHPSPGRRAPPLSLGQNRAGGWRWEQGQERVRHAATAGRFGCCSAGCCGFHGWSWNTLTSEIFLTGRQNHFFMYHICFLPDASREALFFKCNQYIYTL